MSVANTRVHNSHNRVQNVVAKLSTAQTRLVCASFLTLCLSLDKFLSSHFIHKVFVILILSKNESLHNREFLGGIIGRVLGIGGVGLVMPSRHLSHLCIACCIHIFNSSKAGTCFVSVSRVNTLVRLRDLLKCFCYELQQSRNSAFPC